MERPNSLISNTEQNAQACILPGKIHTTYIMIVCPSVRMCPCYLNPNSIFPAGIPLGILSPIVDIIWCYATSFQGISYDYKTSYIYMSLYLACKSATMLPFTRTVSFYKPI
ncbi:hypothetical protein F4779DRAFT_579959 [Xylariaceae sp. FL0662B]|nr:hypothetical protein F4779DRAFT_579959 [Xylariaceae sp. FL0662B]